MTSLLGRFLIYQYFRVHLRCLRRFGNTTVSLIASKVLSFSTIIPPYFFMLLRMSMYAMWRFWISLLGEVIDILIPSAICAETLCSLLAICCPPYRCVLYHHFIVISCPYYSTFMLICKIKTLLYTLFYKNSPLLQLFSLLRIEANIQFIKVYLNFYKSQYFLQI